VGARSPDPPTWREPTNFLYHTEGAVRLVGRHSDYGQTASALRLPSAMRISMAALKPTKTTGTCSPVSPPIPSGLDPPSHSVSVCRHKPSGRDAHSIARNAARSKPPPGMRPPPQPGAFHLQPVGPILGLGARTHPRCHRRCRRSAACRLRSTLRPPLTVLPYFPNRAASNPQIFTAAAFGWRRKTKPGT